MNKTILALAVVSVLSFPAMAHPRADLPRPIPNSTTAVQVEPGVVQVERRAARRPARAAIARDMRDVSPKPGGNTMCCRSKGLPDMNDQMDRRSSGHAGERGRGVGLKNGCPPGLAKRDNGVRGSRPGSTRNAAHSSSGSSLGSGLIDQSQKMMVAAI